MTTIQETKQEKGVRLLNQRLPKVRKGILKGIGNLASSQYDLSEEQVTEILGYLKSDVATVEKLLRNKKSSESFEVNIT